MATPPMVPAGWYADPAGRHEYRYWDGTYWTAGVADGGIPATDPLEAPPLPTQQAAAFTPTPQPATGFSPVQPAKAAGVPPLPAGPGPMAPPGAPPTRHRRRRGWAVPAGIALLVVVGLITGLVIWAPWKSPPLL